MQGAPAPAGAARRWDTARQPASASGMPRRIAVSASCRRAALAAVHVHVAAGHAAAGQAPRRAPAAAQGAAGRSRHSSSSTPSHASPGKSPASQAPPSPCGASPGSQISSSHRPPPPAPPGTRHIRARELIATLGGCAPATRDQPAQPRIAAACGRQHHKLQPAAQRELRADDERKAAPPSRRHARAPRPPRSTHRSAPAPHSRAPWPGRPAPHGWEAPRRKLKLLRQCSSA